MHEAPQKVARSSALPSVLNEKRNANSSVLDQQCKKIGAVGSTSSPLVYQSLAYTRLQMLVWISLNAFKPEEIRLYFKKRGRKFRYRG